MFNNLTRTNIKRNKIKIYSSIIEQSRQQSFYTNYGVPDTPEGRFDMIIIHAFLVLRRLRDETTNDLSQEIFDLMFADMEQNLREMGIGDTGIAKKIMAMAEAFYGRIKVYEIGLKDTPFLKKALNRNLFRDSNAKEEQIRSMAKYIKQEANRIETIEINEILNGNLSFSSPSVFLS
mgnify:FL=1